MLRRTGVLNKRKCDIMSAMKILLIAAIPIALSALAQISESDTRIFDTLLQIPYVLAFGWFVMKMADRQERFIRDVLEILLNLCDDDRHQPNSDRPVKARRSTQDILLERIQKN